MGSEQALRGDRARRNSLKSFSLCVNALGRVGFALVTKLVKYLANTKYFCFGLKGLFKVLFYLVEVVIRLFE